VNDEEFLQWIADRFVHVYGESPNVDFVQRLKVIVSRLRLDARHTPFQLEPESANKVWFSLGQICGVPYVPGRICGCRPDHPDHHSADHEFVSLQEIILTAMKSWTFDSGRRLTG